MLKSRSRGWVCLVLAAALLVPWLPAAAQENPAPEAEAAAPAAEEPKLLDRIDAWFGEAVVARLEATLFYSVYETYTPHETKGTHFRTESGDYGAIGGTRYSPGADGTYIEDAEGTFVMVSDGVYADTASLEPGNRYIEAGLPLIVLVLFLGGVIFTIRYGFMNVRLFSHSINVIRGKFDKPEDTGEVSHFKALTSALSATVGLGNISGVAIAISAGGPGAVFWMWFTAFFGMSMKFSSCTLAHIHRRVLPDGRVLGGPMVYLDEGLRTVGLASIAKLFAVVFAVLTIFASFGGGNMFQSNQTASIMVQYFFDGSESQLLRLGLGVFLAFLVGIVIIGGIRRIGEVTSRLVPAMCLFYCSVCLVIVFANLGEVPAMIGSIFSKAFSPDAVFGGFLGVLVQGMRRAAFSNEAGLGSAAIAHAAAKTDEPVREGVVAMIGPFIDTIVVCTMTALAILITGAHLVGDIGDGVQITAAAFESLSSILPYFLAIAVFVFAYSTIISWGYYGERATEYLIGTRGIVPFRVVYVVVVAVGPILSLSNVLGFSDIMLLSMAFPNIIGMLFLSGKVKKLADDYVRRLESGEMQPVK